MDYNKELEHYGVLGMHWGVRKAEDFARTRSPHDREGLTDKQKRALIIGASAVAASLLVVGGVYLYKAGNLPSPSVAKVFRFGNIIKPEDFPDVDVHIPKGSVVKRISSKSIEDYTADGKRMFATFLKKDSAIYKQKMPGYLNSWRAQGLIEDDGTRRVYEHVMKTKADIKIPSKSKMLGFYQKIANVSEIDEGRYTEFMSHTNDEDHPLIQQLYSLVQKSGYNAIIDENDAGVLAKMPIILLDPKNIIASTKTHQVRTVERIINVLGM